MCWRPGRGFDLTFAGPKDDKTELTKFGEAQYDHLILYAPSTKGTSNRPLVDWTDQ